MGNWFNIKMPSWLYRYSHYKDETVSLTYDESPYNCKDCLYIETEYRALSQYKDVVLPV